MLKRVPTAIVAGVLAGVHAAVLAQEQGTNLGRLMWSAFECAAYAELSENHDEQARLFKIGYDAGRSFLKSIEDQTITDAELRRTPFIVESLLGGPSGDFIIGRVFEHAAGYAHDAVVTKDDDGLPLDPSKWVTDDELRVMIARNKYHRSNCELIR